MTKAEFISSIPAKIDFGSWGTAELQVILETTFIKGATFQNRKGRPKGTSYGISWDEVYGKLSTYLKDHGYISNDKVTLG
jgi:hypothetical protein